MTFNQIVLQETGIPAEEAMGQVVYKRCIIQYITGQRVLAYGLLTPEQKAMYPDDIFLENQQEKDVYDAFVSLMNSKIADVEDPE